MVMVNFKPDLARIRKEHFEGRQLPEGQEGFALTTSCHESSWDDDGSPDSFQRASTDERDAQIITALCADFDAQCAKGPAKPQD